MYLMTIGNSTIPGRKFLPSLSTVWATSSVTLNPFVAPCEPEQADLKCGRGVLLGSIKTIILSVYQFSDPDPMNVEP
jgi:hypothetical protein